jgi:uncharacterized delta-60 repeat protein
MLRPAATAAVIALVAIGTACGGRDDVHSRAGGLDSSFSDDGILTRDFFGRHDEARVVTITRSGDILVGGDANHGDVGRREEEVIVRYRADGSADPSFGRDGVLRSRLAGLADIVEQPDGKLLLIGNAKGSAAVARVSRNGADDRSFGRNGVSVIPRKVFGAADCVGATTAALMSDGRMVLVGGLGCGGEEGDDLGVFSARLKVDGTLDRSFAQRGTWVSYASCDASDVAVQRNGSILVGGSTGSSDYCTSGSMLLTRLRQDGTPDTTFARGGRLRVKFAAPDAGVNTLELDARGRIVVAGYAGKRVAVVRVLETGRFDRAFSNDGKVTRRTRAGAESYATGMAVAPDGRVTISASDRRGDTRRFVAVRFQTDGRPDASFGPNGIRFISFGSNFERADDVVLDAKGRTVTVGLTYSQTTEGDFAVARLR